MKVAPLKFLIADEMLVYNRLYNSLYFEFAELAANHPNLVKQGDFKGLFNDRLTDNVTKFICRLYCGYCVEHPLYLAKKLLFYISQILW
jgi:hypothetical protein